MHSAAQQKRGGAPPSRGPGGGGGPRRRAAPKPRAAAAARARAMAGKLCVRMLWWEKGSSSSGCYGWRDSVERRVSLRQGVIATHTFFVLNHVPNSRPRNGNAEV